MSYFAKTEKMPEGGKTVDRLRRGCQKSMAASSAEASTISDRLS